MIRVADLFAGALLGKPEGCRGAESSVDQPVMRRAQNPEHVPGVAVESAVTSLPLIAWTMRRLYNAGFVTTCGFTRSRQIGVSLVKALEQSVATARARALLWMPIAERPVRGAHRSARALGRAMLPVVAHLRRQSEASTTGTAGAFLIRPVLRTLPPTGESRLGTALVGAVHPGGLERLERPPAASAFPLQRQPWGVVLVGSIECERKLLNSHGVSLLEGLRCGQGRRGVISTSAARFIVPRKEERRWLLA